MLKCFCSGQQVRSLYLKPDEMSDSSCSFFFVRWCLESIEFAAIYQTLAVKTDTSKLIQPEQLWSYLEGVPQAGKLT